MSKAGHLIRLSALKGTLSIYESIDEMYITIIKESGAFNDEEVNGLTEYIKMQAKKSNDLIVKEIEEIEKLI